MKINLHIKAIMIFIILIFSIAADLYPDEIYSFVGFTTLDDEDPIFFFDDMPDDANLFVCGSELYYKGRIINSLPFDTDALETNDDGDIYLEKTSIINNLSTSPANDPSNFYQKLFSHNISINNEHISGKGNISVGNKNIAGHENINLGNIYIGGNNNFSAVNISYGGSNNTHIGNVYYAGSYNTATGNAYYGNNNNTRVRGITYGTNNKTNTVSKYYPYTVTNKTDVLAILLLVIAVIVLFPSSFIKNDGDISYKRILVIITTVGAIKYLPWGKIFTYIGVTLLCIYFILILASLIYLIPFTIARSIYEYFKKPNLQNDDKNNNFTSTKSNKFIKNDLVVQVSFNEFGKIYDYYSNGDPLLVEGDFVEVHARGKIKVVRIEHICDEYYSSLYAHSKIIKRLGKVVYANTKTKKYHFPWCNHINIYSDVYIKFASENDAISNGYCPCRSCCRWHHDIQ